MSEITRNKLFGPLRESEVSVFQAMDSLRAISDHYLLGVEIDGNVVAALCNSDNWIKAAIDVMEKLCETIDTDDALLDYEHAEEIEELEDKIDSLNEVIADYARQEEARG